MWVTTFAVTTSQIGVRFKPAASLVGVVTGYVIEWWSGSTLIGQQRVLPHRPDAVQQALAYLNGNSDGNYELIVSSNIASSTTYDLIVLRSLFIHDLVHYQTGTPFLSTVFQLPALDCRPL